MSTQTPSRPVGVDELKRAWHALNAGEFRTGPGAGKGPRGRGTAARTQNMSIARTMTPFDLKLVPPRNLTPGQLETWNAAYGPKNDAFRKADLKGKDLVDGRHDAPEIDEASDHGQLLAVGLDEEADALGSGAGGGLRVRFAQRGDEHPPGAEHLERTALGLPADQVQHPVGSSGNEVARVDVHDQPTARATASARASRWSRMVTFPRDLSTALSSAE